LDEEEIFGFELFTLVQGAYRFPLFRYARAFGDLLVGWPVVKIVFIKHFSKSGKACTTKIQLQLIQSFIPIVLNQ